MTADRFEQELRAVLDEQAPAEAPLALHVRVAQVAAQPSPARISTVAPAARGG